MSHPSAASSSVEPAHSSEDARPAVARLPIPGSKSVAALVVVAGRLVWTDGTGSIWTMSATGGDARELANQHDAPSWPMYHSLVVHRGTVYAARQGAIATVALPAGPVTPTSWDLGSDAPYQLASDGRSLYGLMFDTRSIARFGEDGKRTRLASMREGALAVAGEAVYSANFDTGAIAQLAPTARPLARGIPHPTGFAADERAIYVWSQLDHGLRAIDLASGRVQMLWNEGTTASDALVSDGEWLYAHATPAQGASSLVRIAKDGSELQVLIEPTSAGPIAVQSDAVYATGTDGSILRLDRARIRPIRVVKPGPVPRP